MMKTRLLLLFTLLYTVNIMAQNSFTGKVQDKDGNPLAGATVKSKIEATKTNETGSFSVKATAGETLYITYVGMTLTTIEAAEGMVVSMVSNAKSETEVIVTGYTSQSKRRSVGSSTTIKAEEIKGVPIGSFDQALQGKAPGVLVQAQSGQPGAAARINIRGKSSIIGSNDPLFIVDGIQISANDFASLNPNDFENFNILKDASSTAIYGSRGSNGVVVITTKRGKIGKPTLTYDFQTGQSTLPSNKLQVMNANQKLDYEIANGNPYSWTATEEVDLRKINTNWNDVFFRKGQTQSHQLSLSGGNTGTRYFISGGIFDQTGTVQKSDLKRYTGRVNLETSFGDFKVGINTFVGSSKINNTLEGNAFIGSPLNAVLWLNPYEKPFTDDGKYSSIVSGQPHPLQELLETDNKSDQLKGIGTINVEYKAPFLKGLTFRTNWGGDYTQDEAFIYLDRQTYQGSIATGARGSLNRGLGKLFRYTGTNSIGYNTSKGDHDFGVTIFNEILQETRTAFSYTGFGIVTPFRNESGITPGTSTNGFIPTVAGSRNVRGLISYFADFNYAYKNKYFVTTNIRRDGSSRFGENKRWANFGSVGAAWLISEENFISNVSENWLDLFKLKVSYGAVGNQAIGGSFPAISQLSPARYAGQGGLLTTTLSNPDLQWEKKTTANLGVEFGLFKNRIKGSFEYYNAITSALFLDKSISGTSGFSSFTTNVGRMRNRGIEAGLDIDVIRSKDFVWSINGQITNNKNSLLELVDGKTEDISGDFIRKVGEPLNTYFLVKTAGVDPATGDQLYLTKDGKTTTNVYSPDDRVTLGTSEAPIFGGFGTDFKFKAIELNVFFSYISGNEIYNNDRNNLENPAYLFDNLSVDLLTEWRTPGQVTNIPRPDNAFFGSTSRFIEDGSFIRLRNVNLSYTMPTSLLANAKIKSLKFFMIGQNLFTSTKYLGWDPELNSGSSLGARYPALRTITAGISIGL
jgi:TonB-dependent starch-binding outer membrane protein SusC